MAVLAPWNRGMQLHQMEMAIPCVHAGFPTEAEDRIDGNTRHHVDGTMRIGVFFFCRNNKRVVTYYYHASEAFNIAMFHWNKLLSPYGFALIPLPWSMDYLLPTYG
jgi:hypothetical protein